MKANVRLEPIEGTRLCRLFIDNVDISSYVQQIDVHHRAGGMPSMMLRVVGQFEIADLPMDVQLIFEKLQTVEEVYDEADA